MSAELDPLTPSESMVYSAMFAILRSAGISQRRFGPAELMKQTGIRSDKTVRVAIRGLLDKGYIDVIAYDYGHKRGRKYAIRGGAPGKARRTDYADAGHEEEAPQAKEITGVDTPVNTPVEPQNPEAIGGSSLHKTAIDRPFGLALRRLIRHQGDPNVDRFLAEVEALVEDYILTGLDNIGPTGDLGDLVRDLQHRLERSDSRES